jgi:predicted nucleic acid-binding protein
MPSMSDVWISNASPLITLAAVGRLDIFSALTGIVRVPSAVLAELSAGPMSDNAEESVRASARFVILPDVAIPADVDRWGLGTGEAQVIAQALASDANGVVLDDLAARRCAQSLDVRVIGTIGLIARAKQTGVIAQAAPIIAAVREAGLYLADTLVSEVLEKLGER